MVEVFVLCSTKPRENGKKKSIQVETDVNTTKRENKEQRERLYNKLHEETEDKELY
jgi:hypothetical protein